MRIGQQKILTRVPVCMMRVANGEHFKRFQGHISYLKHMALRTLYLPAAALFLLVSSGASQDFAGKCGAIKGGRWNEAAAAQGNTPALPAHCEVLGKLNERVGVNSQPYAIRFRLRLPAAWNGRFFFEGGGGSNGNLGNAYGNLQGQQRTIALALGYAVVAQDSGHDNAINNDPNRNGAQTFGFDPQARIDFGYNSYDQVTQAAKALIKDYYGRPPERSYYVGCSEGGREGMMMSQRFPSYYDGILACAPGFQLPKAALFGEVDATLAYAALAKAFGIYDRFGQPLLNKTFTDEDLDLVVQAVLGSCDRLDGLEDGIIDNFLACTTAAVTPKVDALACKGPKRTTCLAAAQIAALKRVFDGAKNSKGEQLYADWAWDRGIGGKVGDAYVQGWRAWKLGAYDAPQNSSISTTLGAGAVSAIFTTPPTPVPTSNGAPLAFLLGIDFDRDAAKLYAESGVYTKSAWDFMMASSTDLSAFKGHGGKLLIVHGVSDPIFSIKDTVSWWNDVNRVNRGSAADFVRMFAVPGMNHCGGGPSTDRFDAFTALVNWVEKSAAPEQIVATAGPNTPWPGRTRPLCAYPKQPRYKGAGSIEEASSFTCQ
ncbi:MAG: tannase/feruloyl esterase family alpha/beta hydrolase [Terriglobia bacterium]|nr:MAG: tannase/feruloyl esterase family alpha/beta hydrolase [Terriglobia bacterium]